MNGKKTKRLDSAIASLTSLLYDKQFDRLTTICKGKYTKRLSELRKRHTASVNMRSITAEMAPGKEVCIRSESEETEYYTVRLVNTECTCNIKCIACIACIHRYSCTCPDNQTFFNMCIRSESEETEYYTVRLVNTECTCNIKCIACIACIHRYSCTCPDNQTFFNMCKHIHYIAMLSVNLRPQETMAADLPPNSADSDSADSDRFHMDTTNGVRLRHNCEAAAHIQQLSRPNTKLEEDKKELKDQLLEMSLFTETLTTQEQVAVVKSAFFGIKPIVTAVRAKETMMSTMHVYVYSTS